MVVMVLIFFTIFSVNTLADVGVDWPDTEEMSKAPAWPKEYVGNVNECEKKEIKLSTDYVINSHIDLNLDGICEVIAYNPDLCGKWCVHEGFQIVEDDYQYIGDIDIYGITYLEPYNGWLQIQSSSYSGSTYYFHLHRFESSNLSGNSIYALLNRLETGYKLVRSDEFDWDDSLGKTAYVGTWYEEKGERTFVKKGEVSEHSQPIEQADIGNEYKDIGTVSVLTTDGFIITITSRCSAESVGCDNVTYHGVSKKSGNTITLKGKKLKGVCVDDADSCELSYVFRNGNIRYEVLTSGVLRVIRGSDKVLLEEQGFWSR